MFDKCFVLPLTSTKTGPKNIQKRPILQLLNKIKRIVELTIVKHPNSRSCQLRRSAAARLEQRPPEVLF